MGAATKICCWLSVTALMILLLFLALNSPLLPYCPENHPFHTEARSRIAVVRPFIPRNLDALLIDFIDWDDPDFFPCYDTTPEAYPTNTDLILYFAYDLDADSNSTYVKTLLSQAFRFSTWRRCFDNIKFVSAHLDPTTDSYHATQENPTAGAGPQLMFFGLMEDAVITNSYEFVFMMEPDTNPIRKGWLDILRIECQVNLHHSFWMKGSIYMGGKYVDDKTNTPWLYHINGNALYNIGSAEFREFLREVKTTAGVGNSYDVSIYEYRRRKFLDHRKVIHKFIYSPFILNYGVSSYSLSALKRERPETFLIHKKRGCPECDPILP